MCGIFAILNCYDQSIQNCVNMSSAQVSVEKYLTENDMKSKNRGPDTSSRIVIDDIYLGFHRLSINGLDERSDQPILLMDCVLICNGEIYNFKELFDIVETLPNTSSDCEVIIHLYRKFGIDYAIKMLDGCFAFVLYDKLSKQLFICRDHFGIRPLFYLITNRYNIEDTTKKHIIGFSSELKQLNVIYEDLMKNDIEDVYINQFSPGHYVTYTYNEDSWCFSTDIKYYNVPMFRNYVSNSINNITELHIKDLLIQAIKKRVVGTSDVPIGCLLSGGLDSSLVTAIVSTYVPNLKTFSIGLEGSEDLKYAKKTSAYIGTNHYEIIMSESEFFEAIPEVIRAVESYDTTTVRASVGNYLISKYISENHSEKVIFNGDGSDELTGGYIYFNASPSIYDSDSENRRLLNDIHLFDVLRSDRSISSNGLESRTPFLDRDFVDYYMSIHPKIRYNSEFSIEKELLRKAFDGTCLLPNDILYRKKEAFSDGVSSVNRSWFSIIHEKLDNIKDSFLLEHYNTNNIKTALEYYKHKHNPPQTLEQLYYRTIFDKSYNMCEHTIPYFWMPKFIDAQDASARTLHIYETKL